MNYRAALLIFASVTAVYVFFGGLKGVLYTDAFQGSIMTIGMLFLLIWAYQAVGGVTAGHQALTGDEGPGVRRVQGHRPPGLDGHAQVRLGLQPV